MNVSTTPSFAVTSLQAVKAMTAEKLATRARVSLLFFIKNSFLLRLKRSAIIINFKSSSYNNKFKPEKLSMGRAENEFCGVEVRFFDKE